MTTRYVLGFMFDEKDHNRVALIEKEKPAWQAGKLNGIGGHIERGELPSEAMAREFEEETGYSTHSADWVTVCILSGPTYTIHVFTTLGPVEKLRTTTMEQVTVFHRDCVGTDNAIPNLTWLLPLSLEVLNGRQTPMSLVEWAR